MAFVWQLTTTCRPLQPGHLWARVKTSGTRLEPQPLGLGVIIRKDGIGSGDDDAHPPVVLQNGSSGPAQG